MPDNKAVISCVCPSRNDGTPRHPDGDTVKLRERLDFRSALAARNAVVFAKVEDTDAGNADILAALTEGYLVNGIEAWTIVDEKGKPVPVTKPAIRAFLADHIEEAMSVGSVADDLYYEAVLAPLVREASSSLPPTPTTASTSVTNGSRRPRQKRSKPSSITTIRTAGTERMTASGGGGYS